MVGNLNWLVTLGHYDIHYTVCILVQHMMMPRYRYLHIVKSISGYLKQNYKFSIDYDMKEPNFSMHNIEKYDWFPLYSNAKEEEPPGMPEPKSKLAVTSGFFDSSHASCIAVDLAVILRYNLRLLGASVK
eukprot:663406-Ditylum_brightwellii.AAC.1